MKKINLYLIILALFLVQCKNESNSSKDSNNSEAFLMKAQNEDSLQLSNKLIKVDSCFTKSNTSKVVILKDKVNSDLLIQFSRITDGKVKSKYQKKINSSQYKFSSIECNESRIIISFDFSIGNSYLYSNYIFDINHFFDDIKISKVFHTESNRNGISIKANHLDSEIPINDFNINNFNNSDLMTIYSFYGFQENKIPSINEYFKLFKSVYDQKKYQELALIGDIFVLKFLEEVGMDNDNITKYNDIAFYLGNSKMYKEAIFLLEKITHEAPNRTVAYINLGDAYWGIGEKEKAKKAYQTYVEQMKANGKESKIPKIVLERI